MFRVIVDGKEVGKFNRVASAKKWADKEIELGGYFCEIYRCRKLYTYRFYNRQWS